MIRRSLHAAIAATIIALGVSAAGSSPARAQQAQAPVAAETQTGPRVQQPIARVEPTMRESQTSRYMYKKKDTVITVSSLALIIAVVVLVLVLI